MGFMTRLSILILLSAIRLVSASLLPVMWPSILTSDLHCIPPTQKIDAFYNPLLPVSLFARELPFLFFVLVSVKADPLFPVVNCEHFHAYRMMCVYAHLTRWSGVETFTHLRGGSVQPLCLPTTHTTTQHQTREISSFFLTSWRSFDPCNFRKRCTKLFIYKA